MLSDEAYKRAITRNLHESAQARLERKALASFEYFNQNTPLYHSGENFFSIVLRGLFNSMMGHLAKVLDRHPVSASFWTIFETNEDGIRSLKAFTQWDFNFTNNLSDRVKYIRNKTLFHIDRDAVLDPKAVWRAAGITGEELGRGLSFLWSILEELHERVNGRQFHDPCVGYDGSDVVTLLQLALSERLLIHKGAEVPLR